MSAWLHAWPEVLVMALFLAILVSHAVAALLGPPPPPERDPRAPFPGICRWPESHAWTAADRPWATGLHEWCTRCGYARPVPAWRGHLVRLAARVFHVEPPSAPERPQDAQGGPNTPRSDFRAAHGPTRRRPDAAEPCTCTHGRPCPQHRGPRA